MSIHRFSLAFALVVLTASVAAAQDVVHLKNGKVLSGSIVFEGDSKAGFLLRRWDTGGEVFIKWNQIPDAEAYRIRTRVASPDSEVAAEDMIDAERIVTNMQRELLGVVQNETKEGLISIKTIEGVLQTSKSAVVLREKLKVKESEVYTADERVDRKAKGISDTDFEKLVAVAGFANSLKAYARAKDFYQRAEKVAPADRKEEMKGLASAMDLRIVEDNAEKALAAVRKLASELEFQKAIDEAQKFLADFAETSVAKANAGIVTEIENRRKEYVANRDKFLEKDVPEQWRKVRDAMIAKYAGSKVKLQEAREGIAKIDEEIVAEVAKKLKATPEEVNKHWSGRKEKVIRKVGMDDGTWIHRGGQDGGMDYSGSGDDELDDFKRRFGDGQDPKKKPQLGKALETANEWWQNASNRKRRDWLETLYADTSSNVKKEEVKEDNCKPCKGQGKSEQTRGGKSIEYTCHECHGVKKTLTIRYW